MENRAISLAQGRDTALTGQLAALDAQRRQDLERLLGVPLGTVMSRLSRARARMPGFLETGRTGLLRRVK